MVLAQLCSLSLASECLSQGLAFLTGKAWGLDLRFPPWLPRICDPGPSCSWDFMFGLSDHQRARGFLLVPPAGAALQACRGGPCDAPLSLPPPASQKRPLTLPRCPPTQGVLAP